MRLFIAEKPALGKVIAEALGSGVRRDGYIQCGADAVTWCIGHILELAAPEAHNPSYAKWKAADLPLKLRPARYQPKASTAAQFSIVQQLISQASEIVHAGDPDDEGQLLVDEVLTYCHNTRPVKRLLISDLNSAAAKKALATLRDNREFFGLSQKALARSIGDQLYGFNMTRACTLAAQQKGITGVLSVGRVQTPILGLIVNRFNQFQNHKAAFFYNLIANIDISGQQIRPRWQVPAGAPADEKGSLIDETIASNVAAACKGQPATVTASLTEEKSTPAPLPFSLLDLQAHMSKKHGLSAQQTLDITQSLRENHRAITYNRSDCNYLTREQFGDAAATLAAIGRALPLLAGSLSQADPSQKGRAFDDKKVSAHTAIIPTTQAPNPAKLTADERNVYQAIAAHYLAQFLPDKRYLAASATFAVNGHLFVARATQTTQEGWTALLGAPEAQESEPDETTPFAVLAALKNTDTGICESVDISKEKTRPLPLYTEATLLKDLQRVAKYVKDPKIRQLLKERDAGKSGEHGGIGTPATRASMLETLQKRGFYTTEKKKLIPTALGLDFIAALPDIATAPDMTALWHEQQQMIEQGSLTVEDFLDTLDDFIATQVVNVDLSRMAKGTPGSSTKAQSSQRPRLNAPCPKCNGAVVVSAKVYACAGCDLKVWADVASKTLTPTQAETLISKGKTGLLKGFKSKAGKSFDARLVLDKATGKVSFEFEKSR